MTQHNWSFFRAGGVDQVCLDSSDDLRNLRSLDLKLWVALACPVAGLEADAHTLALLDADKDGRVRAPEILAAIEECCRVFHEPAELLKSPASLPLRAFRDDTPEAKSLLASARALLGGIGKADAQEVLPGDVVDEARVFAAMSLNGDGIVNGAATSDPAVAAVIGEIVGCFGARRDRGGADGVDAEKVEAFFAACAAFAAWSAAGADVQPLGPEGTPAAAAAIAAVRAKVDDYFARGRLAAFDARGLASLNGPESTFTDVASRSISASCAEIESLPLARIGGELALPLGAGINPAWRDRVAALRAAAVVPFVGEQDALTEPMWREILARIAPYAAWQAGRAGAEVAGLGLERVQALLAGDTKARILALQAADAAYKADADGIANVARLAHYYCHLGKILRNFVNFGDFYGRREKAVFQAGTVYFDQRSCDLVIQVQDAGRHGGMAGLAGMYLAYLDCVRRSDGRKMTVCAAVTDGDADNLMVGRNGLFYDRQGRDYDATITKIVDNPISIRQAFWSPYKKFLRAVEDFVAKRAAAAEAESSASMTAAAEKVATADKLVAPATPAAPAAPAKIDIGTVAALGVAVGGITAALGAILDAVFGLGYLMPLGLVAMMLFISGPSMLIAALKLRRRNLGPLLDADGWALNAQALVNIPFGRSLTQLATLPVGANRDLFDPFAQKKGHGRRWLILALLAILAIAAGLAYAGILQLPG